VKERLIIIFKYFLTIVGQRLSKRFPIQLQAAVNYLKLGFWMQQHKFTFSSRVKNRNEVWQAVAKQIRNRKVLYLEFGVYKGTSMRYWSRELKHPEAKLHGFDSFEGLPENGGPWHKGQFNTSGILPKIEDTRVQFFAGWFNQVLPTYFVPEHDVLVITMDADLYSSTIYVLRYLQPHITPGTFIYFDDLNNVEHEPMAFDEFMRESGIQFKPVCADKSLAFAFFECIG